MSKTTMIARSTQPPAMPAVMPTIAPINSDNATTRSEMTSADARALRGAREQIAAQIVGAEQMREARRLEAVLAPRSCWDRPQNTGPKMANSRMAMTRTRPMRPVGLRQMSREQGEIARSSCRLLQAARDARVEHGIEQIDQQIGGDVGEDGEQDARLDDRDSCGSGSSV